MKRCHDKYNFGLVTKNREKIEVYIHVFTYIYFSTLYYNEDINFLRKPFIKRESCRKGTRIYSPFLWYICVNNLSSPYSVWWQNILGHVMRFCPTVIKISFPFKKWCESCSVISDSLQPHGVYSPWNSPGQNTGVGPFSRGSSQPWDWTQVSCVAGRFLTSWATREAV